MDEKKRKEFEALTADHERWDNRELGASEEHLQVLSDEQQNQLDKEIDDGLGLQHISIRLNKSLIEQLKQLAQLDGIGYQPLIRQVLTRYAKDNEHKLDMLLSAAEAAERADRLFAQAIRLREQIPNMAPLSNERIFAETDYMQAIGQSQSLFAQALDTCKNPILKQHAKLRMSQIAELAQQDLQDEHDRKYGKKKHAI